MTTVRPLGVFVAGLCVVFLQVACSGPPGPSGEACECDGLGVELCEGGACGPCMCLPLVPATPSPVPTTTFYVDPDVTGGDGSEASPWAMPDWALIDAAVATGDVLVVFSARDADGVSPEVWPSRIDVHRTDRGPFRVELHGSLLYNTDDASPSWMTAPVRARAVVPGVHTGYDDVSRDRITVRGFDVTDSDDKGIYWRAGDDVVIEDNLVHDNRGSPALNLDYVSRSGLPSTSFVVRNNHIWDHGGECVYIGGSEGEDLDAHELVLIENNIIHDCWSRFDSKHDGINIKDRIASVVVTRNVIFNVDWGIELASPGEYSHNLIWGTGTNGFHVTDLWGLGLSGLRLVDNAVIDAKHSGAYFNSDYNSWNDVRIERFTAIGSGEAGVEFGGAGGVTGVIADIVLVNGAVGFDAFAPMMLEIEACHVFGNGEDARRELSDAASGCTTGDPGLGDLSVPAGPDGIFFTDDDPWIAEPGGARP